MKATKKKVQVSLDDGTLNTLDSFVERFPDVESRSEAIRWATRKWDEVLKANEQKTRKDKPST